MKNILIWISFFASFATFSQIKSYDSYFEQIKELEKQPENYSVMLKIGDIYTETGYYSKANHYYLQASAIKNNIEIQKKIAQNYIYQSDYYNALSYYKKIVENNKNDYLSTYKLAQMYAKTHQTEKAVKLYQKLEKIDKTNPNYPYQKGRIFDDGNKKINAFLNAYRRDHTHVKSIYQLVRFFNGLEMKDSSMIFVNKGLKLRPKHTGFLRYKVVNLFTKKKYKQAIKKLELLDSLHYDALFVNKNLGLAYLRINQLKNAEKYLLKAFQIDKNDSTTHYYIGLLLFAKKKYNQAIPYFEMAIALQKPKTDAENYQLGLIYKEKKKFKKAIAYFSKAYQNNPKHYKAYFEKVLLTDVYYKNSKKSINLYQKYLKLFEKKEKFKTYHAKKRIKEIETEMFFNKKE